MGSLWVFILLWGIWLIIPVLVDGVEAGVRLAVIMWGRLNDRNTRRLADDQLPVVSVIVPAHNEEEVIDRCLNSLKLQDYPHDKMEIIVIDDHSTDATADCVGNHVNGNSNGNGWCRYPDGTTGHAERTHLKLRGQPVRVGAFHGFIELVKNGQKGKAHALNAGIERCRGDIIVNVDSDVVLAHDAVRNVATAFHYDNGMGAATGNIEIDWDIIEERDADGHLMLDEEGHIRTHSLRPFERFLARAQFLEYLASFRLGRQAQGETNTIYTLAGAFSAFRRSAIESGCLYSNRTVSEDTDMTLNLHKGSIRVGFI